MMGLILGAAYYLHSGGDSFIQMTILTNISCLAIIDHISHIPQAALTPAQDDGTEIVVVSDTVRQRRARTPSSGIELAERLSERFSNGDSSQGMPDVLPKTFRLAEASSLFTEDAMDPSKLINSQESRVEMEDNASSSHKFSIVEIKEGNLSSKMSVLRDNSTDANVGQIVDTINILERCDNFEPEYVETVHIVDASSDTDTGSTPILNRKSSNKMDEDDSMDELEVELEKELELFSNYIVDEDVDKVLLVEKQRISFDGKQNMEKDRDFLKDSEQIKLRPSLKELLMEERNSFYSPDKENDEALVFSEDEDIPRYSIEMATDSDSDVVKIIIRIY